MATITSAGTGVPGQAVAPTATSAQAAGGLGFDAIMLVVSSWLVGGVFLDGWAHSHLNLLDTFFTPWHAVLYTGGLAVASFLGATLVLNHTRGYAWRRALPAGYDLSLLGMALFILSGVGDMIWHILFGVEQVFSILLSPTHLGLGLSIGLIISGPLRAAWHRPGTGAGLRWVAWLPLLISLTFLISTLTFLTEYIYPLITLYPASFSASQGQMLGVLGILLTTAFTMGPILLAARRWPLPPGALLLVFALNGALMGVFGRTYLLTLTLAVAGGLAAEGVRAVLRPTAARRLMFRLFAFAAPAAFYLLYFVVLGQVDTITWPIHVWTGAIVESGFVGWLLSFLVLPPPLPAP